MLSPIEKLECELFALQDHKRKVWRITPEYAAKVDSYIRMYEYAIKVLNEQSE